MRLVFTAIALGVVLCFLTDTPTSIAQEILPSNGGDATSVTTVLASVGGQAITRADVDYQLGRTSQLELPALPPAVEQTTIHLLGMQRQALQTLRVQKGAADREEVMRWIETNLTNDDPSATANQIVDGIVRQFSLDREVYLDLIAFRLSWKRYLAKHMNDVNLGRHFENQKARFDGTVFTIAMISVPVPAGMSERRSIAVAQLQAVQNDAGEGEAGWTAAEKQAEQRQWEVRSELKVRGSGSVDPSVIDPLLRLPEGETSRPFHTAVGVHIVRLKSKQAGNLQLVEVADEVRAHLLVFLLEHLAHQSRQELPLASVDAGGS